MKSGNLNFLEPSGPLQACNGTALPLPPSCAVIIKCGNLNFLKPSGPLQACNGTALPFTYISEFARTNRCYNERGSSSNYVPSSISHFIFSRTSLRNVGFVIHFISIRQRMEPRWCVTVEILTKMSAFHEIPKRCELTKVTNAF